MFKKQSWRTFLRDRLCRLHWFCCNLFHRHIDHWRKFHSIHRPRHIFDWLSHICNQLQLGMNCKGRQWCTFLVDKYIFRLQCHKFHCICNLVCKFWFKWSKFGHFYIVHSNLERCKSFICKYISIQRMSKLNLLYKQGYNLELLVRKCNLVCKCHIFLEWLKIQMHIDICLSMGCKLSLYHRLKCKILLLIGKKIQLDIYHRHCLFLQIHLNNRMYLKDECNLR